MDDRLDTEHETELTNAAYLRDLAERLREIPVRYGVDGYDIDRLVDMARELDEQA